MSRDNAAWILQQSSIPLVIRAVANKPMSPPYRVLFLLSAPQGWLAEVKRLDQPSDAPKSHAYHWLWFGKSSVTTLQFLKMPISQSSERQERIFEEAKLWFDQTRGELNFSNRHTIALTVQDHKTLPTPLHRLLLDHFN